MIITREQFVEHFVGFLDAADNPEYGGTLIDWIWDWLIQQGSKAPATGPDVRWLQLRIEDLPGKSIFSEVFEELKNIGKEPTDAANNPR